MGSLSLKTCLVLPLLSLLMPATFARATAVSVPVIDLSGVWTAIIPARQDPRTPSPAVLYTLTLERTESTVDSTGTSVDLFYDADLVIDGYRGFDTTPEIPFDAWTTVPCRRRYIDDSSKRLIAWTTSPLIPVHLSVVNGYSVSINMRGHSTNPDPLLMYSVSFLSGGAGAHVDLVAEGLQLSLEGVGDVPTFASPISPPPGSSSESGTPLYCHPTEGLSLPRRGLQFVRVATGGVATATGNIGGFVKSKVQTQTVTEKEVQRFTIEIMRQPNGGLRPRGVAEPESDYLRFLATSAGLVPVAKLLIAPDSEGVYPFGAPGDFMFRDVPVLEPIDGGGFSPVFYTLLVSNGQTDELVFDDQGAIVAGETTALYFGRGFAVNVRPETAGRTIKLAALDSVPAKQTLVERLSGLCEINYRSAELPLVSYLEQIASGGLELTEARNEGLKRGVWAERVAVGGVVLADQLYDRALGGLGTVLADAFDDLSSFAGSKLSRAQKRLDRIKASGGVPAGFKAGNIPDRLSKRIASDRALVANSEFAGVQASAIKALKPLVVAGLTKAGALPNETESLADNLTLLAVTVLSAVKSGSLGGATKPLIKKAIEEIVKASKPLFLDGSDAVASSYCQVTRDDLAYSVAQTQSWPSFDQATYVADRTKVIDAITRMNTSATVSLVYVDTLLGVASGLDAGQDALAVLGTGVKQAKVAEKLVQATKYITNVQAIVDALIEIYVNLPLSVNEGTHRAFGQEPTLAAMRNTSPPPDSARIVAPGAVVVAPDTIPYFQTLDALRNAIESNDIGLAIDVAAEETPTALPAVRAAWQRALAGVLLQALAVPTSAISWNIDEDFGVVNDRRLDILLFEVRMWESVSELFEGVLAGDYAEIDDPSYLLQKNRALSKIFILRKELAAMLTPMNRLVSRINGADAGGAAVMLSLEPLSSDDTGEAAITLSPERFTVTARVANLADATIGPLTAQLEVLSATGAVTIVGTAAVSVGAGNLGPNDNADGGSDEADVTWTIEYTGDFTGEVISLSVELLEAGGPPVSFLAGSAEAFLLLDPQVADADLDFMPDSFETQFGLDTGRDDGEDDLDGDGVSNLVEQRSRTFPNDPDSDDDGLSDGEELTRGADGVITDPLDADTDDDGTDDGTDGAPIDASTIDAPVFAGEPVVGIDSAVIALGTGSTFAEISVVNEGSGTLLWSASVDRPDVVSLVPGLGTINFEGSALVTLAGGYLLLPNRTETVTITFTDEAGITHDESTVRVIVGAVTGGDDCGDANDSGGSGSVDITATDALLTLRSAVGLSTCERCRCDVDASGTTTATDALAILNAAIGINIGLTCAVCF